MHSSNTQSTQLVTEQRCDGRRTHSVPEIVFESGQSLTFTAAAGEGGARIGGRLCRSSNGKERGEEEESETQQGNSHVRGEVPSSSM